MIRTLLFLMLFPLLCVAGQDRPASSVSRDSIIRIGLLLPLSTAQSLSRLHAGTSDDDAPKNERRKLSEPAHQALDFYEGLQYSLSRDSSGHKLAFYIFDTEDNDSLVEELVKNDTLRMCDIIIGPTTHTQAKTVSAFCKKNNIINIQPFVAAKSFSTENPWLVRFMPTIDAHLQKEYEMVLDSFGDKNIIVYTTKKERDLAAARQLDTLFKSYNAINTHKLRYTLLNTGDSSMPVAKRNLSYHLLPKEQNILIMTCYDEPVVNSVLRSLKDNIILFGMPTWIDAEQMRTEYLNNAHPYFTDPFYADTARTRVADFISGYMTAYEQKPSRYSYLGYDAMTYLSVIFSKYGKAVKKGFDNESYDGLGYNFHISPVIRISKTDGMPVINYYTNTAMHLFQVSDYKVLLIR